MTRNVGFFNHEICLTTGTIQHGTVKKKLTPNDTNTMQKQENVYIHIAVLIDQ